MSLKKMMMKLAIAMVAAKGGQMYAQAGGLEGIKRKLAQQKQSGGGIGAMLGNLASAGGGGAAPQKAEHLRGLLDTTATPEVPEEAEAYLPIGQTPVIYLKRLIEHFITHRKGYVAVQKGCDEHIRVELYPLAEGWTLFARYTGNGREERGRPPYPEGHHEVTQRHRSYYQGQLSEFLA